MTTSTTQSDMSDTTKHDMRNWLRGLERHTIYWSGSPDESPLPTLVSAQRRNDSIVVALARRPGEWAIVDKGVRYSVKRGLTTLVGIALAARGCEVDVRRMVDGTLTTWARWAGE